MINLWLEERRKVCQNYEKELTEKMIKSFNNKKNKK
jgi:hypothetical protein